MGSGVRFYSEDTRFVLRNKRKVSAWIAGVVSEEKQATCNLTYIFCSDSYLLDLNRRFLDHDTLTDIITFPDADDPDRVSGDIFISVDRVRENAEKFGDTFEGELARVIVHGALHLLGYKDKTLKDKALMREREDRYLSKRFN